jgi:hypothetical protein
VSISSAWHRRPAIARKVQKISRDVLVLMGWGGTLDSPVWMCQQFSGLSSFSRAAGACSTQSRPCPKNPYPVELRPRSSVGAAKCANAACPPRMVCNGARRLCP